MYNNNNNELPAFMYNKAWYETHREQINEKRRMRHAEDSEQVNEKRRQDYARRREECMYSHLLSELVPSRLDWVVA